MGCSTPATNACGTRSCDRDRHRNASTFTLTTRAQALLDLSREAGCTQQGQAPARPPPGSGACDPPPQRQHFQVDDKGWGRVYRIKGATGVPSRVPARQALAAPGPGDRDRCKRALLFLTNKGRGRATMNRGRKGVPSRVGSTTPASDWGGRVWLAL